MCKYKSAQQYGTVAGDGTLGTQREGYSQLIKVVFMKNGHFHDRMISYRHRNCPVELTAVY